MGFIKCELFCLTLAGIIIKFDKNIIKYLIVNF